MKRIGNTESNKTYNPRNVKAQIPIDIDEVDGAMERYIRQKYEQRLFMTDSRPGTRSNTGSSSSVEDRPPPLPPKPTKGLGFGLRKVSTQNKSVTPPISPGLNSFGGHDVSPPRVNKPSRVFGSSVTGDGLDSKLATLRDMGFPDDKRNSQVLKGLNGNLDRAVEALIRLGEQNPGKSRGNTPTPPDKLDVNGLMLNKAHTMPITSTTTSTNPFDALDALAPLPQQQPQGASVQTQQQHPYGGSMTQPASPTNPFNQFTSQQQSGQFQQQAYQQPPNFAQSNPFGQQPHSLEQSLQGLQISSQQQQQQPAQPLFPNRTGSYAQQPNPPFAQSNPFQQSFTPPPMPQMPPQYGSFYQQSQSPPQAQYQSMSSPSSPGNPFLKSTRSQMFSPPNTYTANPFDQIPPQQQQQQQQHYQQQSQMQPQQTGNPFMMQQQNPTPNQQAPNPYQQQQSNYSQFSYAQQAHAQQSHNPFDKSSILALYNQPQLAPQRPEQSQTPPSQNTAAGTAAPQGPSAGHMNPFAGMQTQAGAQQPPSAIPAQIQGSRHVSNESVDFAGLMGGRHSPDAFSGLSASFRR